jgi:hypothetical protein
MSSSLLDLARMETEYRATFSRSSGPRRVTRPLDAMANLFEATSLGMLKVTLPARGVKREIHYL